MPQFNDTHVKICGCFIVWDGITRPEQGPDNKLKYSLKVVVDPNSPDMGLFHQLSARALQESKWKGTLPAGARMPVGQAGPSEFNGMFNGWAVLNCNSQRLPDVYDENGQLLDQMQYGPMVYGGQKVDVLVHCYEYDKAGNKGIATGLDGFSIIASAQAPRQQFGSAGVDTSGAFGGNQNNGGGYQQQNGGNQNQNQNGGGGYQQQNGGNQNQNQNGGGGYQQQNGGNQNQNQNGGGGYQQQNGGNQNQNQNGGGGYQQQNGGNQNQNQNQNQNGGGGYQQQNGGQPQQAHDFLPDRSNQ